MRIAIVGGKLQGIEAAYLAKKAGWEVWLLDRRTDVPAAGLCDRFSRLEVTAAKETAKVLAAADLVLPALENYAALEVLGACAAAGEIRLAFDLDAFLLTSSKIRSNALFDRLKIASPGKWPACRLPVIVKPDGASGSRGVCFILRPEELISYERGRSEVVIQEFIPGPSYSLEVMGVPGHYDPLQVTSLEMDAGFDCKRVVAPAALNTNLVRQFKRIAVDLAGAVSLKGLMDVEAILHAGQFKVLEIDARLPSQTPTVVYWSTGVNMLHRLGRLFSGQSVPSPGISTGGEHAVIYEHIRVSGTKLEVAGEHIMGASGPLQLHSNFFGADEAITSYRPGRESWAATLIFSDTDARTVVAKREKTIKDIRRCCHLDTYVDKDPIIGKIPKTAS